MFFVGKFKFTIMMILQKGIPLELRSSAAKLFLNAFGDKFTPILGKGAEPLKLIESSINIDNCISAIEDRKLMGFLAIQTQNESFFNPSFRDMVSAYGLVKGVTKAAMLSLITYTPLNKETHIECIAVAESERGKGIGTSLINELFSQASKRGHTRVTLEVVSTNPKAEALYKQLGFCIEKRYNIWPINKIIGWSFSNVTKMYKPID